MNSELGIHLDRYSILTSIQLIEQKMGILWKFIIPQVKCWYPPTVYNLLNLTKVSSQSVEMNLKMNIFIQLLEIFLDCWCHEFWTCKSVIFGWIVVFIPINKSNITAKIMLTFLSSSLVNVNFLKWT